MPPLVLERFIECTDAQQIIISSYGLREGIVAEMQDLDMLHRDPLIAGGAGACAGACRAMRRCPRNSSALPRPLFPEETLAERRLRVAACWLVDISWRIHPEYRRRPCFPQRHRQPVRPGQSITPERAFIATVLYERYPGGEELIDVRHFRASLSERARASARVLGRAMRYGMAPLRAAHAARSARCRMAIEGNKIDVRLPPDLKSLRDEALDKRKEAIEDALARMPGRELLAGGGR